MIQSKIGHSAKVISFFIPVILLMSCVPQQAVTPETRVSTPTAVLSMPSPTETSTLIPPTKEPTPTSTEITTVTLKVVTGDDGTVNNPVFEVFDTSGTARLFNGAVVFSAILDKNNDLQAGHSDAYDFKIHDPLCKLAGWHLRKPGDPGGSDSWSLNEIYVYLNGTLVYFDKVFAQNEGPITLSGKIYSGNWTGTQAFKQMCGA